MFNSITIVFGALLLLALLAAIAIWVQALSAGKTLLFTKRRQAANGTDPVFLRGNDLFLWARNTAARIVAKYLRGLPTETTPVDISRELHEATNCGMFPLGSQLDEINMVPCPREGQGLIGVTAPEAIEIADYVRRNLSADVRDRIRNLAIENATKLTNVTVAGFDSAQTPCPLQGTDGVCLAYLARPLRCRPLHAATNWQQRGIKRPVDAVNDYDEQIVEQGAEEGLTEALVAGGRDGNVYELNSALVTALDTPDAAKRWADGDDVFHQCRRIA